MKVRVLGLAALALLAACGGAAAPSTTTPATSATAAASATSAPASAGAAATKSASGASWTVGSGSKAVVSVREQLVGVSLPSDAVLTATGAQGSFTVNPDGSFTPDSKITFDLTSLASDQRDRDNFIKQSTLQTRQFATATFVPTKATGLTLPLASGESKFTLLGNLTIHGVTKAATFDVVATQTGGQLTATATANPSLKFDDFGMTAPSVPFRVVSVTDEIRLVVTLVATPAS